MAPQVAIIIPSWNTCALLEACLRSVMDTCADVASETMVVDNGSSDGSAEMVRDQFPAARLIQNADNRGFARACNQGIAATTAPYALLLNSDARVQRGTVSALLACADAHPRGAVIGALIRNEDGTFQASFSSFPSIGQEILMLTGLGRVLFGAWYPSHGAVATGGARCVDWVSGAGMLVRRTAFDAIGRFDERYFMYSEEMDLCRRSIQVGWEVWYEPAAVIVHLGGGSSRTQPAQREINLYSSRVQFCRTHRGVWNARAMAALMLGATAIKRPLHSLLRYLTAGRMGRTVAPLALLWAELRRQV